MNVDWTYLNGLMRMRIIEAIQKETSMYEVLEPIIRDAAKKEFCNMLTQSIMHELATIRNGAHEAGLKFTFKEKNLQQVESMTPAQLTIEIMTGFSIRDYSRISEVASYLCAVFDESRKHLRVEYTTKHGDDSLEVTVEAAKPGPIEVRVIELPDRETRTILERNPAGDITGSIQYEQDAA